MLVVAAISSLVLVACGEDDPAIVGVYAVTSFEQSCAGDPITEPSFFGIAEHPDGNLYLDFCPAADSPGCGNLGQDGKGLVVPSGDQWEHEVIAVNGGPAVGCTLYYVLTEASLAGTVASWSSHEYAQPDVTGDDCTEAVAEARGATMPCVASVAIVGDRVND